MGSNDEFNLLIKCSSVEQARSEIKLINGESLHTTLMNLRLKSRDDFEALDILLDSLFLD